MRRPVAFIRSSLLLALSLVAGCDGGGSSGSTTTATTTGTDPATGATLQCTSDTTSCDHWHPATSPFDGTYDDHGCVQWQDPQNLGVYSGYEQGCALTATDGEGTRKELGEACPKANRVGGCLVATDVACIIQYAYADSTVLEAFRATPDGVRAQCEASGGVYVE